MINEVASAHKVYNVAPPFLRVGFAEVGSGLVGAAADADATAVAANDIVGELFYA